MSSTADNTKNPAGGTTLFASPDRKSREEVVRCFHGVAAHPIVRQLLDAIPEACALLNKEGQVVLANRALTLLFGSDDPITLCGLRLGEILDCTHALERNEGCGTTESCSTCGAAMAILNSRKGLEDVQECRILREDSKALDLRVSTKQIFLDGQEYTLLSAADIGHEKRRKALERIFFHDIINTAGALHGFAELLADDAKDERGMKSLLLLSKRLLEEIAGQRELLAAESNELSVNAGFIRAHEMIEQVGKQYDSLLDGKNCVIRVEPSSKEVTFRSDPVLLRRVLCNLLKNAVEASSNGDVITMGARAAEIGVEFWIHNPGVISRKVQLQMFQRSFSTKGSGRGLGTYGAKLITEQYLKGGISFTSSAGEGTTFRAAYPIDLPS